ncbi:MAG: hypothetical protein FJ096_00760 [Deltaproteobacteria bacterium]|nr:hypothetical protein [Deltaproteobacteria bacterium]
MRTITMTALFGGLVATMLAPACGSGDAATTTTSASVSVTVGSGGSMGTGGSGSTCAAVTELTQFIRGNSAFFGKVGPQIGGADPDYLALFVPQDAKGTTTFTTPKSLAACGDTELCLLIQQDVADSGVDAYFVPQSGSAEIVSYDGKHLIEGKLTDVTLIEATIDDKTGDVTAATDGRCLRIAELPFVIKKPVPEWTCNPGYYDETKQGFSEAYCDCACGAVDPDCATAKNPVEGCLEGQTCDAKGACEGVPNDWTCPKEKYAGGKGTGCDCACGAPDPDCELTPAESVNGCMTGDVCSSDRCVPGAWKCPPNFYDEDMAGPTDGVCDCGCGVKDPDCKDGTLTSCDFCDDMGSCSTKQCKDNMDIKADDNAVCK